MKRMSLREIKRKANLPGKKSIEKKIDSFVCAEPNFSSGRKRPKSPDEAKILGRFTK